MNISKGLEIFIQIMTAGSLIFYAGQMSQNINNNTDDINDHEQRIRTVETKVARK